VVCAAATVAVVRTGSFAGKTLFSFHRAIKAVGQIVSTLHILHMFTGFANSGVRVSVSICVNTLSDRVVPERLCAGRNSLSCHYNIHLDTEILPDQQRPRPHVQRCPHVPCPKK